VARSKGGTDHLDNLQLLCNHRNSVKGTMDQAAFKVKLSGMGLGA
jgi:5-methylcytosine-specific restriction endonuclease McrA